MSVPFQGPQIRLDGGRPEQCGVGPAGLRARHDSERLWRRDGATSRNPPAAIPLPQYLAGFEAYHQRRSGAALLRLAEPGERADSLRNGNGTGDSGIWAIRSRTSLTISRSPAPVRASSRSRTASVNPSRTAKRGDVATLFITGEGAVRPSLATGTTPSSTTPLSRLPSPQAGQPTVTVGELPRTVQFVGIPSGLVGVTQINFTIPAGVASGVQPVVVTVGNASSNTATITVQ